MLSYSLKFTKNTESINAKVANTNNGTLVLLSKCAVCESKKWDLSKIKKLVGNLRLKTPFIKSIKWMK